MEVRAWVDHLQLLKLSRLDSRETEEEMEERVEAEKAEDVTLPGFRFHPTDEELVGFYLKRKIQQRRLPIELIKQVDIYKYDPWDLPKVAASGEKEWYFYCPRDRKYRNSARPNRVTGAGFWKATGTDRPIYSSSDPTNCIGLKKSLVFYRGRAAKGFKTDWMMHEFRLPPSLPPSSSSQQSFPPDDSWAICRIFKKTSSMSQRAISQSWMTSLLEPTTAYIATKLSSDNISSTPRMRSAFDLEQVSSGSFSALDFPSFKHLNHPGCKSPPLFQGNFCNGFTIPPLEVSGSNKRAFDSAPGFSLHNSIDLTQGADSVGFEGGVQEQPKAFSISFSNEMVEYEEELRRNRDEAGDDNPLTSIEFPFSLSSDDAWKPNLEWDSPPFTSEMSTSCSTTKCYT